MKEVFIACTLLWIPFIILGIAAFIKILRKEPDFHKDNFNPFEKSNKFIEEAKKSYIKMLEEEERIV